MRVLAVGEMHGNRCCFLGEHEIKASLRLLLAHTFHYIEIRRGNAWEDARRESIFCSARFFLFWKITFLEHSGRRTKVEVIWRGHLTLLGL
jgi:hypothetical protein